MTAQVETAILGTLVMDKERDLGLLVGILLLVAAAIWVDWPGNPGLHLALGPLRVERDIRVHQGLDLRGGTQLILEADAPPDREVSLEDMATVRRIIENRIDSLGVVEPEIQLWGERRIMVGLPGIKDPEQAVRTLKSTGLLEFVDLGYAPLEEGARISTTLRTGEEVSPTEGIFETVMTGKNLRRADLAIDPTTQKLEIHFELDVEGARLFEEYTTRSVGRFMAIVLDEVVISAPRIQQPIPEGRVRITSPRGFTRTEAQSIVTVLRYGALPIALKKVGDNPISPTLGQESVQKSVLAGAIGLGVVLLFMLSYYRLLGVVADLALCIYALLTFALFKLIPVTLTLPGLAGFILSVGMAVDANILIFERMKEELRGGRTVALATQAGFVRAWTSIRDSNLSTLLTCLILFWFGQNFGAGLVKGFAVTLFFGVVVSMFTAITVTRIILRYILTLTGEGLERKRWLLGV